MIWGDARDKETSICDGDACATKGPNTQPTAGQKQSDLSARVGFANFLRRSPNWGVLQKAYVIFSTESARATLLQRGDASRGSSAESARATLLQRGDAFERIMDQVCQSDLAEEG